MNVSEMIEVLQAYQEGKKIEFKSILRQEWRELRSDTPVFNFESIEYRVAPAAKKVKYLCFDLGGILTWRQDTGVHADDWIRIPKLDKEVEI